MIDKIRQYLLQFKKPNKTTFITVDSYNKLYCEEYGNPQGEPFIYLHGGPGGSFDKTNLKWFNFKKHRIILFDQRACGRSISYNDFFTNNTTWDMIEDIEKIRLHLNCSKLNIFGGSWGGFLAIMYAIKYPQNVKRLFLWGLLLGNEADCKFLPREYMSNEENFFCDNLFFLTEDNWVLNNCKVLSDIPINLCHGAMDNVCSVQNSIKLKEQLTHINLYIDPNGFHSSSCSGIYNFLKNIIYSI